MTKREAKHYAHKQVFAILQSSIDAGCEFEVDPDKQDDFVKVRDAISDIAQYHFEKGHPKERREDTGKNEVRDRLISAKRQLKRGLK